MAVIRYIEYKTDVLITFNIPPNKSNEIVADSTSETTTSKEERFNALTSIFENIAATLRVRDPDLFI